MIDYRLLGPLEVTVDGHALDVGGLKQRALLAILVLHANQPVPRDVLVSQLWGEHPPGPDHAMDVYIWRLRKTLDPAAGSSCVQTRAGGYLLRAAPEQVDLARFERLAQTGERSLAAGQVGRAAGQFREALALWRGQPLADFAGEAFAQAEITRLETLRAEVAENRIDSDLAVGRHADVVSELAALAAAHPLRERLHGQLMIALYRSGRQAEALEAYQAARRTLVEELGLEPGPALQRLESAILRQDASLESCWDQAAVDCPGTVRVSEKRQPRLLGPKRLVAVAAALAVVIALPVAMTTREPSPPHRGTQHGRRDRWRTGRASAQVVTGVGRPNGVAYGAGAVWVTDSAAKHAAAGRPGQAGQRSHPSGPRPGRCGGRRRRGLGRERARRHRFRGEPGIRNSGRGDSGRDRPRRDRLGLRVGMGRQRDQRNHGVQDRRGHRCRGVDHFRSAVLRPRLPSATARSGSPAWTPPNCCASIRRPTASRRPSRSARARTAWPWARAAYRVADGGGAVTRVNPRTGQVRTIEVGGAPAGVVYADGAIWVASGVSGTVSRIGSQPPAPTRLIPVGNQPTNLAASGGCVVGHALPSLAAHRGGTLTVIAQAGIAGSPPPSLIRTPRSRMTP